MKRVVLSLVLMSLTCAPVCADAPERLRVSVIQLVANPERYTGKPVFVTGFLTIALENDSLCATPVVASSSDCIWVQYDDGPYNDEKDKARFDAATKKWAALSKKRVSIKATFNQKNTGHLGGSPGALERITEVLE